MAQRRCRYSSDGASLFSGSAASLSASRAPAAVLHRQRSTRDTAVAVAKLLPPDQLLCGKNTCVPAPAVIALPDRSYRQARLHQYMRNVRQLQ
jgi:hypothetical protein